jgi:cyclase
MLKKRIIPVLFLKNGLIVRSERFEDFRELGDPLHQLDRLNDWQADELIYIDISREGTHDLKRDDMKVKSMSSTLEILTAISKKCFMPLTFGGRIKNYDDVNNIISHGADKVVINSALHENPALISQIADSFGSQCLVAGIDVRREADVHHLIYNQGNTRSNKSPLEWAMQVQDMGAGEIFINSIDRDGMADGFDIEMIEQIALAVKIPVIACGGAGQVDDFYDVVTKTHASAVAAGNIFNFTESAYVRVKQELYELKLCVKPYRQVNVI